MTAQPMQHQPDPVRDLLLERVIELSPEQVWTAWTQPEHLTHWFTPAPWSTVSAEIDLRPGGIFRTVMRSPEGDEFDNAGCILEVVPHRKFAWTGALGPGYRPRTQEEMAKEPILFSAVLTLEPHPRGTKYSALAIHPDEGISGQHAAMGFHKGWGAALDQLVAYMKARATSLGGAP